MRISTRNLDTLFPKYAQKIEASADEKSGWLSPGTPYGRYLSTKFTPVSLPYLIRSSESPEGLFPSPAAEKPKGTNEDSGIEITSSTKVWPASLHWRKKEKWVKEV